ncbi:MAG TPA: ornithine cyclodeaminase family protein [Blastocatellia bacterium]|nr:ornithine cyclodeaminase family protein [Blastocatellia bacterium]
MLILNQSDLGLALAMRDCIEAVEEGFQALAGGDAVVPERLVLDLPDRKGVLLEMPAHLLSPGKRQAEPRSALGTKIVSVFAGNAARNLDMVQAVYLLLDGETGVPLALMDGRFITALRTAATSALATKLMAAPGAKRLAVFGAGTQARFHMEAMFEVCEITEVFIASRTMEKAQALALRVATERGISCKVVSHTEAAREANLICACTSAPLPLFDGKLLGNGTHINAVGAFTPATRELDTETVRRSRVIIDAQSAAGREAGEILIPLSEGAIRPDHIKGSLGDLVTGKVAGRERDEEITLFKSSGHAIEDLVTARLAYQKAIASGMGKEINL